LASQYAWEIAQQQTLVSETETVLDFLYYIVNTFVSNH